MRKFKFIALMLVCGLLLSGCTLVSINKDRVAKQVVATVNGENIYKNQVDESFVKYYVEMSLYYNGQSIDSVDAQTLKSLYQEQRTSLLQSLVLSRVMLKKAPELGISLTEEEMADNRAEAEKYYQSQKDSIIGDVLATPTAEAAATSAPAPSATPEPTPMPSLDAAQQAKVDEQYQAFIDTNGTIDEYYQQLNDDDIVTKVGNWIDEQAAVSDEDALAWYNSMQQQQKEATDVSASAFESYVQEKNIITYVPADTVAVKQVFFKFDDAELVDEAKALYENGKEDLAFELLKPMYDELKPKADEAYQRLLAGESIDDLIAEMGEDPGMTTEPTATCGYLVEKNTKAYVKPFCDAALTLFNISAVSKPVESYMGIHVLQSIKLYEAGPVPFENIKESIKAGMLDDARAAKYDELTKQWLSEAKITYYYDRLNSNND